MRASRASARFLYGVGAQRQMRRQCPAWPILAHLAGGAARDAEAHAGLQQNETLADARHEAAGILGDHVVVRHKGVARHDGEGAGGLRAQ